MIDPRPTTIMHPTLEELFTPAKYYVSTDGVLEILRTYYGIEFEIKPQIQQAQSTENTMYLIDQKYALRISRKNKKPLDWYQYEYDLCEIVDGCDFNVPQLYKNREGQIYTQVQSGSQHFVVTLMKFVPGYICKNLTPEIILEINRFFYCYHQKLNTISVDRTLRPHTINSLTDGIHYDVQVKLFDRCLKFEMNTSRLQSAIVHADIHIANIFVDQSGTKMTGVIDFDDTEILPLSYDIGGYLWTLWSETKNLDILNDFSRSYPQHILTPDDRLAFVQAMKFRNYYFAFLEMASQAGKIQNQEEIQKYEQLESELNQLCIDKHGIFSYA